MAIIYYPSGSTQYVRTATYGGMIEQFINVAPNQIIYLSGSTIGVPADIATASYALTALNAPNVTASGVASPAYILTGSFMTYVESSYVLSSSDNGLIVTVNSGSTAYVTVSSSLPYGFSCTIYQSGSGKVTCISESTTIIRNRAGLSTGGQYAMISLIRLPNSDFVLTGDATT